MKFLKFKVNFIDEKTSAFFHRGRSYEAIDESNVIYVIENHEGDTGYIYKALEGIKYEVTEKK